MNKQIKPFCLWFTGLPSSGKTTIAMALKSVLQEGSINIVHLDGDILRKGLTSDLGFSAEDRAENLRRVTYLADIMVKNDIPVVTSFISPYKETRSFAREVIPNFIEIYISTSLDTCMQRDVKGLYAKAAAGEIKDMTGIGDSKSSRYDVPKKPEIKLATESVSIDKNVKDIINYLYENKFLEKED